MSHPHNKQSPLLQQLLQRGDVWRGQSILRARQPHWSSGYPSLDAILTCRGWPLGQLIETCQPDTPYAEWLLWGPTIAHCSQQGWVTVLLNPPTTPLLLGLQSLQIDPTTIWLVEAEHRRDFVPTLAELLSTSYVGAVFAWEPYQALSYSELRKLQLAQLQTQHLCCLFRSQRQRLQSSPAALRIALQLKTAHLSIHIFKQKGSVHQASAKLPLPAEWHTPSKEPINHARTPPTPLPTSANP